jgi:hypothetical protein
MSSLSKSSSPCGCSGNQPAPCHCNLPSCASCSNQGLARPRFFAGQLLTEDDLEALGSYVVGKNRLHNRMLFGDGVVCGLNVLCHPCGGGKLVVKPGYALDCCGNDIVVPCEQELDVLALLRELRETTLGPYGCKDPCAEAQSKEPAAKTSVTEKRAARPPVKDAEPAPARAERYCLYVRYCEERVDPVSPYASSGSCGAGECEPTRIREGFGFELRCREEPERVDIVSSIVDCFGDLLKFERAASDGAKLERDSKKIAEARAKILAQTKLTFTAEHLDLLVKSRTALASWVTDPSSSKLEALLEVADWIGECSGMVTRRAIAEVDPKILKQVDSEVAAAETILGSASVQLEESAKALQPAPSPLESAYLEEAADVAHDEAPDPRYQRLRAEGIVYTQRLEAAYIAAIEAMQRTLLAHLAPGRPTADCTLREAVATLPIPTPGQTGELAATTDIRYATDKLVGALLRVMLDCVCLAITPPCAPCDDSAVLLACLDVKDCEVTGICNTERKFVLTGHAMRYWLPPLGWLGELLELACCTLRNAIADATSLRALSAWAGVRAGSSGLDLGENHAIFAAQHYYGSKLPSSRELARLPLLFEKIARAALFRLDVPVAFGAPATPAEAAPAPHAAIRTEVERALTKELPRAVANYVGPNVTETLNAKLPFALDSALSLERVAGPVTTYLQKNLAAEVRNVARSALEKDLERAVLTIANQRIAEIAKKQLEAVSPAIVEKAVSEGVAAELEEKLEPAVRRVALEKAEALLTPEIRRVAKEVLEASLDERLDDSLGVKVAKLLPASLSVLLGEGEVPIVNELVNTAAENATSELKTELEALKEAHEAQKRSEGGFRGNTSARFQKYDDHLAKLVAANDKLTQEVARLKAQLEG